MSTAAGRPSRHRIFRAGGVEFNEATRTLSVDGDLRPIETKPCLVLLMLLEGAPHVVSKQEILDGVWAEVIVAESSLTTAMHQLRHALGPTQRDLVKTVPGFGYRVTQPVEIDWVETRAAQALHLAAGDAVPRRPQWRLERPLGGGAARDVWLARHEKTEERRVFKFADTTARLEGLKREAAYARILQRQLGRRDDLVPVLEWHFDEPPFFIEYPYAGADLAAWAAQRGGIAAVPVAERMDLVARAARTVAEALSAGVLHGDIKPGNILVAGTPPAPRLTDFGAGGLTEAARREALTLSLAQFAVPEDGERSGSLLYAAPEVLRGGPPTAKADVYALGILVYQMVVGDLEKPLAAGWEAEIADPVLRGIIGAAAAGDPAFRTPSVAVLAEQLVTLDAARAAHARHLQEQMTGAALAEQVKRARLRRPWLMLAAASLVAGTVMSATEAWRAAQALDEARHQSHLAQAVNDFLTKDLLGRADPHKGDHAEETLMDAAQRAEADVPARFGADSEITATIYAALAGAFEARDAFPAARVASDNAVRAYCALEGANSPHAAILRLQRATMEASVRTPEAVQLARDIVAAEELRLVAITSRRDEAEVALHTAKGMIAMASANGSLALAEYQSARKLADSLSATFDAAARLRLRYHEAQAQIMQYHYTEAAKEFAEVAAAELVLNGPRSPDTLYAQVEEVEAASYFTGDAPIVQMIDSFYPAMVDVLGQSHSSVLMALGIRGASLMELGRYAEARRDFQTLFDAAGAANPVFAIDALAGMAQTECRAGDTQAGLATSGRALAAAQARFGSQASMTAGAAVIRIGCMIQAGQLMAARQALTSVNKAAAETVLPELYAGATFDLYEAAIAHGLGDEATARTHLIPLLKAFTGGAGNTYQRRWTNDLATAVGLTPTH
jgi:DNA-binding winged helix-turn-helix (wHTH) protein